MHHTKRTLRLALLAATGLLVSGCTSDPAFWEAVAAGLDEAAYDIAQENAGCYWAPPPGLPYGANQRYCPGDYGYRDMYPLPASYYRDQYRDGRREQRRDRDHDDRGGRRGDKGGRR